MCTRYYNDPSGKLETDGRPVILTDLIFCKLMEKCCGVEDIDPDTGLYKTKKGCCNT